MKINTSIRRVGALIFSGALASTALVAATTTNASAATTGRTNGPAVVHSAAVQVGRAYCWGGGDQYGPTHGYGNGGGITNDCGSNSTAGFDCSGLALYVVYHTYGILLPHNSEMQGADYRTYGGQLIRKQSMLQPGDIMYFGGHSMSTSEHVAIYAGVIKGQQMMWDANIAWGPYGNGVHLRSIAMLEGGTYGMPFDGAVRYHRK